MPMDYALYPKNWKAISAAIRERAGNRCEWPGCSAPNGELIVRPAEDPERWRPLADRVGGRVIKVVLTVAHLNHTPMDCRDGNLLALCQLHHLRYDAALHGRNAARTRREKRTALHG